MTKKYSSDGKDVLVLIDGNSLLNRAFYATPLFSTRSGLFTNGIFGFLKLFLKIKAEISPKYAVVTFDVHAPTFRHKMYAEYKAGRHPMPEELVVQVPVLKECLSAMGIKICEKEGFEADDLIGTLSKKFDVHSVIYTGDRDSYQLVSPTADVYFTKRGVSDIEKLTIDNFKEHTGLVPSQVIDLKALMGDKSDNIPGVAGIGEKTAFSLLNEYSTVEGVYENLLSISGATGKKLAAGKEQAFFSKTLATINTAVPLDVTLTECLCPERFGYKARAKFVELEFNTFLSMDIFTSEEEAPVAETKKGCDKFVEFTPDSDISSFRKELKSVNKLSVVYGDKLDIYFDGTEYSFAADDSLIAFGFTSEVENILRDIFSDEKKTVVVYRYKDFMHKAEYLGIDYKAAVEDVSLMKYLVDYTGKDEELSLLAEGYGFNAAFPAHALYEIYLIYGEKLEKEGSERLYRNIELPLVEVLFSMENDGVCVDIAALGEFDKKYTADLKAAEEEVYSLAGERFNIKSPSQLGDILFGKMGLKGGKKSKKGGYSTNADILEKLAPESELVRAVLRYREVQKIHSTYIDGMRPCIRNGKIHTTYNQTITSTGRLSSANPNLQNIPIRRKEGRLLRRMFVASEENVLVDADYSQIELRLLAHFSGCKELIEAYNNGEDIHALTASQVFGVPREKVTKELRTSAKAVNFGIIYGISAFGLSQDLNISVPKAQDYIDKYFARYSAVKEYMENNIAVAKNDGYITTFTGRKRVINELKSPNYNIRSFGERAARNMPLQGSSADIIKIAMINVYKRLLKEGLRAKLILQVHDELVLDCPENEAERAAEILKYEMENAVTLRVPLTVEVGIGKNWYDAK